MVASPASYPTDGNFSGMVTCDQNGGRGAGDPFGSHCAGRNRGGHEGSGVTWGENASVGYGTFLLSGGIQTNPDCRTSSY